MKKNVLTFIVIIIFNQISLFGQSSNLEEPEFTDKDMLIVTLSQLNYVQNIPSSSAYQSMARIDRLNSLIRSNLSTIGSGDVKILNTVGWLALIGGAIGYSYDKENRTLWQIVGIGGIIILIVTY